MTNLKTGDTVAWTWGSGTGEGKVEKVFTGDVTRKIKGKAITRKATDDKPAYLIGQEDGAEVLKSETELKKKG